MIYKGARGVTWRGRLTVFGERMDVTLNTPHEAQALRRAALLQRLEAGSDLQQKVLVAVKERKVSVAQAYEASLTGDAGYRALLAGAMSPPLAVLVPQFLATCHGSRHPRATLHLGALQATGATSLRDLTTPFLTQWLDTLSCGTSSRRQYGVSVRRFLRWAVEQGYLAEAPRLRLAPNAPPRERWLDLPDVVRVIEATRGAEARCALALLYGGGLECQAMFALRARDCDMAQRMVQARGTKNQFRDRQAFVESWAWTYIAPVLQAKLPTAPVVTLSHKMLYLRHREALAACHLSGYTLHDARHSWAVRAVKRGMPLQLVASNLGHADATMVLKVYGKYRPRAEEYRLYDIVTVGTRGEQVVA